MSNGGYRGAFLNVPNADGYADNGTTIDADGIRTRGDLVVDGDFSADLGPKLEALRDLVWAANEVPFFTGAEAVDSAASTAYGRSLWAGADAAAVRTLLGLGTMAVQAANNVAITGGTATLSSVRAPDGAALNLLDNSGNVRFRISDTGVPEAGNAFRPTSDAVRDLGGSAHRWRDFYLSRAMHLGEGWGTAGQVPASAGSGAAVTWVSRADALFGTLLQSQAAEQSHSTDTPTQVFTGSVSVNSRKAEFIVEMDARVEVAGSPPGDGQVIVTLSAANNTHEVAAGVEYLGGWWYGAGGAQATLDPRMAIVSNASYARRRWHIAGTRLSAGTYHVNVWLVGYSDGGDQIDTRVQNISVYGN